MFGKEKAQKADMTYLSLNTNITESDKISPEPSADILEQMESMDPPLSSTWCVWEQRKQEKSSKLAEYSDATKNVCSFSTVKEFWACWNHIPQPSELFEGKKFVRTEGGKQIVIDSLAIFKDGVAPEWEDPQNANGGHFMVTLKTILAKGLIDELWNNIVLGIISGSIEPAGMITGARLIDRLDNKMKALLRIEVWFNEYDEESASSGKVYDLRGSFERCMRLGLDGKDKSVTWGRTEMKSHVKAK